VLFTGIEPDELVDPHHPPRNGKGPYVISGNNRSSCSFLLTSCFVRLTICKEIIRDKLHPHPELFREFDMEVFCFPDPSDPEQVMFLV